MKKIFGREPAMFLALVSSIVMMLGPILGPVLGFQITPNQQGAINAVAAALVGILTSFSVAKDGGLALIVGLVKAILALGIAFGVKINGQPLQLDAGQQAIIMTAVTTLVQFFVRTQVTASLPAPEPKTVGAAA